VYVIRFVPQSVSASRTAIERIDPTLDRAARGMGATSVGVFRRVTLPLAAPGILTGGVLVFVAAAKELPATLILRPTGFDTLATRIWDATTVAHWSAAAIPALALVLLGAIPTWYLLIRPSALARDTGTAEQLGVRAGD
jgi:iron(III) transport system permease protein